MEFSSIYGVIKIDEDYAKSIAFIKSLGTDTIYPFVCTNMFGLGEYVKPFYYDNMLLTFGTTYKSFGLEIIDWNLFIFKIEHVLRNIDFENAKFHVDSFIGDFTLNWINKTKVLPHWKDEYGKEEYRLIETDEFFFGFGDRPLFSPFPDERYKKELDELSLKGFQYPVQLCETAFQKVRAFNTALKDVQVGTKVNFSDITNEELDDRIFEVLYSLKQKNIYDFNEYKGNITLLQHVEL